MQSHPKVFIYSSTHVTDPLCVDDTRTLMETEFGFKDVKVDNFATTNFSGLSLKDHPIIIVPGGSAMGIGKDVSVNFIPHVRKHIQNQFHSIWICAGAYAVAGKMDLYRLDYESTENGFTPPQYRISFNEMGEKIGILSDYDALGPFYPNNDYSLRMCMSNELRPETLKQAGLHVPMAAKVNFASTGKTLTQLYLQGPALIKNESINLLSQTQGTFFANTNYQFNSCQPKTFKSKDMGAVVIRPANPEKSQGGVAVWSTHPEAAVNDSKLLKFFKDKNEVKLSRSWHEDIIKDSRETVKQFTSSIKEAFKF